MWAFSSLGFPTDLARRCLRSIKNRQGLVLFRLRVFIAQLSLRIDFLDLHLWNPQRTDLDRNTHLTQQFDLILTPPGAIAAELDSFPLLSSQHKPRRLKYAHPLNW